MTPRTHVDYLATYSLLSATTFVVRVLREVKLREDEYVYTKSLLSRVHGLHGTSSSEWLVTRERRLLSHGSLQRLIHTVGRSSRRKHRRAASLDSGSEMVSESSTSALSHHSFDDNEQDANGHDEQAQGLYAFVFTDVVVFANLLSGLNEAQPAQTRRVSRMGRQGEAGEWELCEDVGICRLLGVDGRLEHSGRNCKPCHVYLVIYALAGC